MTSSTAPVRIGNAQAFWGDRNEAAAGMLQREPHLDFLTLDYLAEVSMSILAMQRDRDPARGYAADFVDVVRSLAPYWSRGGRCRVITNAGGLDPRACAEACRKALEQAGCRSLRIGIVTGDDVLNWLQSTLDNAEPNRQEFQFESPVARDEIRERLLTANVYLGAEPVVRALDAGADIVITGRLADPSLTVAACRHHFDWSADDWDRLAGATVAGHLIECGTQVTGGILTDWLDVPDPQHLGYPIVEVSPEGSFVVTKPAGTGGVVDERTVKEQLLYEIGDPNQYLSPDVTVSFLSLQVDELGLDRVHVMGASGRAAAETLKVSATYRDGYRAAGSLTIFGNHAVAKARRCGEVVLQRVAEAGFQLRDSIIECLGTGDCVSGVFTANHSQNGEVHSRPDIETVLRIGVEAESRAAVERFSRELMPFAAAGPQGTTGYAAGRPRVQPVIRFWPCFVDRQSVKPAVEIMETTATVAGISLPPADGDIQAGAQEVISVMRSHSSDRQEPSQTASKPGSSPTTLREIAYARSGDKGTSANIGVIARQPDCFAFLRDWLTAERVVRFFAPLGVNSVERFELPNLAALNFVLHGVLRRGVRTDVQGKALGQAMLEMRLES